MGSERCIRGRSSRALPAIAKIAPPLPLGRKPLLDRVSLLEIDIMISEGYDFQDWSSLLATKRTYLRADYTRDPIDWADYTLSLIPI